MRRHSEHVEVDRRIDGRSERGPIRLESIKHLTPTISAVLRFLSRLWKTTQLACQPLPNLPESLVRRRAVGHIFRHGKRLPPNFQNEQSVDVRTAVMRAG